MSILQNSNAISAGGYDIKNSLRLRRSNNAYLSRTPASAGNQKTWTYSAWVKRGLLGSIQDIWHANGSGTSENDYFAFDSDTLQFRIKNSNVVVCELITTQVFRDPSAWYHIIVAWDSTQATSSNRVKIYVNGVQITSFSTATYPSQNTNTSSYNNNVLHTIGTQWYNSTLSNYYDGYITEINFIDGQALTPSSFGETDTTTGVWKPKAYSGTYGTNGFYLKFSDIATTSGSNAGLGKDFSGNSNYWTTNNISVTSGTTYDAMTDSPTNTSATVANYATLNPILQNSWWAAVNRGTIQDGNLTFATGAGVAAFSNFDLVGNSGKWYYEMTCSATDSANAIVIAAQSRSTFEVGYYQSGSKQINSATPTSYGSSWTSGDVMGVAIDVPNNNITFYKNNVSQGVINNAFPTGQPVYVGAYYNTSSGSYGFNFGQQGFKYTPPSGYIAMNTYNLPDSTIKKGNSYMDATLYTGNGTNAPNALSVTNSGSFKPDLVWIKIRSGADIHNLQDSVRGLSYRLSSNNTNGDSATGGGDVSSLNSNGFTISYNNAWTNANGSTYVGWQWQAGQGSTSSNTSGSITSTVSVNTTAGFSIVTYTGTGANATVGHGLGVAPKMVIVKRRNTAAGWPVYHASYGNTGGFYLNTTAAGFSAAGFWNNTTPTSTVFSLGTDVDTNQSSSTYVAYCWAEIAGFSKFGSYTGNGSTDGPFVYTGFRPKFIMVKRSDGVTSWFIHDTARDTYNVSNRNLYPNLSAAEEVQTTWDQDIVSNGFKTRGTSAELNASGGTYIYAAFAENPFKNANAR